MKSLKYFIPVLAISLMMGSCTSKKTEEKINQMNAQILKMKSDSIQKDSVVNALFASLNTISENLSLITARKQMVAESATAEKAKNQDVREKILQDIQAINNLMDENRNRIAALKSDLKKSNLKIAALEETINTLNMQLDEKEKDIAGLKEQLVNLNFTVASLNNVVDTLQRQGVAKSQVIASQDEELNTVWYAVGTKKDLLAKGIIVKEGKKPSGELAAFTKIDLRKVTVIPINMSKAELLTTHPAGSYKFKKTNKDKTVESLEITNPMEFWKASKFLVIQTK
jgi:chromosome segregation ATPase